MLLERFPREYGGYRLTALLGQGGSAEVYRAEVPSGGEVAIRRIARVEGDEAAEAILFEEGRVWVALNHPNIVRVLDVGQHEGDWFLVLELVDGVSAEELVLTDGALSIPEALLVTAKIAEALGYANEIKIRGQRLDCVHRDVKPANILVSKQGAVKLTDFGIARTNDRLGRTAAGTVRGSVHFMAPEQVRKEPLDRRTDLFALGCTLHVMLTGHPLLDLPKDGVLRALNRGDIPLPDASLPDDAREIVRWMCTADPAGRPPRAADVVEQIRLILPAEDDPEVEALLGARAQAVRTRLGDSAAPTGAVSTSSATSISERTSVSERTALHDPKKS